MITWDRLVKAARTVAAIIWLALGLVALQCMTFGSDDRAELVIDPDCLCALFSDESECVPQASNQVKG